MHVMVLIFDGPEMRAGKVSRDIFNRLLDESALGDGKIRSR